MDFTALGKRITPAFLRQSRLARWLRGVDGAGEPRMVAPIARPASLPLGNLRETLAREFIRGRGIEIGAFCHPLFVPAGTHVTYVDRCNSAALRHLADSNPHLRGAPFVAPDVIDEGEILASFSPASLDFIIANHFIEHVQDPAAALRRHLELLRPNGILYLAVPDRRWTFDVRRPETTIEHLLRDHREGPAVSFRDHLREWASLVESRPDAELDQRVEELAAEGYPSIHYHVWTQETWLETLLELRRLLGLPFEVAAIAANRSLVETISVLRRC